MRQIPLTLIDAVAAGEANEPLALLACWAERGPEARLVTAAQLAGANDPVAGHDSHISATDGVLQLAPGNSVAMDTAATPAAGGLTSGWAGKVTEVGQEVWA